MARNKTLKTIREDLPNPVVDPTDLLYLATSAGTQDKAVSVKELGDVLVATDNAGNLWDAEVTYTTGMSVVGSDNRIYASLVDSNINFNPTSSPLKWVLLNPCGSAYASNVTYKTGDICTYASEVYYARTSTTGVAPRDGSGNLNSTQWVAAHRGIRWDANSTYYAGNIVMYLNRMFRAMNTSTNQAPDITTTTYWKRVDVTGTAFDSSYVYLPGDIVTLGNNSYVCTTMTTVNAAFQNSQWRVLDKTGRVWNAGQTYNTGDLVSGSNNVVYVSMNGSSNTNKNPTISTNRPTYWKVANEPIDRLIATLRVKSVGDTGSHVPTVWNDTSTYVENDLVFYQNYVFWAKQAIPANTPPGSELFPIRYGSNAYWQWCGYKPDLWVSGQSYNVNDHVMYNAGSYYGLYRCKVATSGTTAPSSDTTNWADYTDSHSGNYKWTFVSHLYVDMEYLIDVYALTTNDSASYNKLALQIRHADGTLATDECFQVSIESQDRFEVGGDVNTVAASIITATGINTTKGFFPNAYDVANIAFQYMINTLSTDDSIVITIKKLDMSENGSRVMNQYSIQVF